MYTTHVSIHELFNLRVKSLNGKIGGKIYQ